MNKESSEVKRKALTKPHTHTQTDSFFSHVSYSIYFLVILFRLRRGMSSRPSQTKSNQTQAGKIRRKKKKARSTVSHIRLFRNRTPKSAVLKRHPDIWDVPFLHCGLSLLGRWNLVSLANLFFSQIFIEYLARPFHFRSGRTRRPAPFPAYIS